MEGARTIILCDENYTFNLECKKLFWIEFEDEGEQESTGEEVEEEPIGDTPAIFYERHGGGIYSLDYASHSQNWKISFHCTHRYGVNSQFPARIFYEIGRFAN